MGLVHRIALSISALLIFISSEAQAGRWQETSAYLLDPSKVPGWNRSNDELPVEAFIGNLSFQNLVWVDKPIFFFENMKFLDPKGDWRSIRAEIAPECRTQGIQEALPGGVSVFQFLKLKDLVPFEDNDGKPGYEKGNFLTPDKPGADIGMYIRDSVNRDTSSANCVCPMISIAARVPPIPVNVPKVMRLAVTAPPPDPDDHHYYGWSDTDDYMLADVAITDAKYGGKNCDRRFLGAVHRRDYTHF